MLLDICKIDNKEFKVGDSFEIDANASADATITDHEFSRLKKLTHRIKEINKTNSGTLWIYSGHHSFSGQRVYIGANSILINNDWDGNYNE